MSEVTTSLLNHINVWLPILSGLVMGIITHYLTQKSTLKKIDKDSQKELIEQLMARIDSLTARIDVLEKNNEEQSEELLELRSKNRALEERIKSDFNHINIIKSYYTYMPKPAWLKGTDGLMFFVNDAYERQWGISRLKYEGQPDERVWPESYANQFKRNDELVLREMKGMSFMEQVPNDPQNPEAGYSKWDVYKFPVVYKGELLGIGGVAIKRELS